jgi:phosphomannomutase
MNAAALIAAAVAWRDQDPDPATHAELDALINQAHAGAPDAIAGLEDRFGSRLVFGTAGLRGALGAGPNRMNRVLVSQAAAGLAAYLVAHGTAPSVVIGYDGRTNSEVFARDTAVIMAGAGVRAILLPRHLPTPVLAFAVRELTASAGVMVTASHNPATDNGYKVYLGGLDHGSQIVPPADAAIAAQIDRVARGSIADLPRSTDFETASEDVIDAYVGRTAAIATATGGISFVYSAMHGVGWQTASAVFAAAGFAAPTVVTEQIEPDAAFPTVAFPNPEEPGAMDLTLATAKRAGVDLAVVNDPDADRLAVAVPGRDGEWRRLSGNEVGILLGWRAAERLQKRNVDHGTFATSIVSSPALREIARVYNIDYQDTLTGFKWISRVGGLVYGFEEALGYLVDPNTVRDKDGISAAVEFLSMVAELKAVGKTVDDHLDDFAARFGCYASGQLSVRVNDLTELGRMMEALRHSSTLAIGGLAIDSVDDFSDGFGAFPPSDILRVHLKGNARVIVRPSGTEPKLKVYVDAWSSDGTAAQRRTHAESVVAELIAGMHTLLGR